VKTGLAAFAFLCGALLVAVPGFGYAAETVSFAAADGVKVFADYYPAKSKSDPLVLLFHQAGSNRGEYATIAPVLVMQGFNALAIDQRSGGELWGRKNETVEHLGHGTGYEEALPDLEAALVWAKASGHSGKLIVWGSSYSASLVFLLAAKHQQEVAALLAFSPGEYFSDSSSVRHAAEALTLPIFVTSAKDADEIEEAKSILGAARSSLKVQFVPKVAGIHGASTLRSDRNPDGAAENWAAVKAFLGTVAQK